jgi:hypothetical protein
MLYWNIRQKTRPMVIARIEFLQEHAHSYVQQGEDGSQPVFAEMQFDSPEELIAVLKEFEYAIKDCTADINGRLISLSGFKTT